MCIRDRFGGGPMSVEVPTRKAIWRVMTLVPSLKAGLRLTILLAVAGTAIQLAIPVAVQQIIDKDILGAVDTSRALRTAAVALVAMVIASFARRASTFRLARTSARGLSDLRVAVFAHLHRLSVLHVEAERRGSLVARVTSDVYRVQDFMEWGGMGMLVGTAQVVLAVVAMLIYRWELALLVVAGVTVYGAMLLMFQRVLGRAHDRVRHRVADSMSALGESISGLAVVRAYGAVSYTHLTL